MKYISNKYVISYKYRQTFNGNLVHPNGVWGVSRGFIIAKMRKGLQSSWCASSPCACVCGLLYELLEGAKWVGVGGGFRVTPLAGHISYLYLHGLWVMHVLDGIECGLPVSIGHKGTTCNYRVSLFLEEQSGTPYKVRNSGLSSTISRDHTRV